MTAPMPRTVSFLSEGRSHLESGMEMNYLRTLINLRVDFIVCSDGQSLQRSLASWALPAVITFQNCLDVNKGSTEFVQREKL